ncbi:3-deoxy-D-manno-octulosonic acid transferase [Roseospira marina]|uniref:3-deoxy-D-manno-octulosonic acid transferase n=1 Tax=Roseospira marina TaxID=140057 RepID=A0A5M6IFB9_9PROT|nr:3-deoxy-D-manno-octulosonic acid transferase [Roseospira marina]KAA5606425.1 3-deoxy-D-manno-octulosonic acid transferase [Roseospira marina]MBB4314161.1 3-deoxy-D-manno-octulosonic-acid transferase [Roseospira marina]MBB5087322.1 3-deoxy-D-manno-octulosonic-acid transferase [Roseospira marina]
MPLLTLYRGLIDMSAPAVRATLWYRRMRGKEDAERFGERLGEAGRPRPEGPLVWLHGASVGESLSLLPLIERLRAERPALTMLCTTGTVTSAALMAERLPPGAVHQFIPVDRTPYIRRFLDHWRPDLLLLAESELWPTLVLETAARGVPMALLNGRMSDGSFRRWRRYAAGAARGLLSPFRLALAQSEADAERLRALGADPVACVGNLKFAAAPAPADPAEVARLREALGGRPCWLALSTHDGEEALTARVHQALAARVPDVLTLVMPRHAARGDAGRAAMEEIGVRVAQRSRGEAVTADTDVYLMDTMGEVGLAARLAPVVFMGKSLIGEGGGQNPLEPARLGAAVLFGPRMENFRDISARMLAAGAARTVPDEAGLVDAVAELLTDAAAREDLGRHGAAFADGEQGVLPRVLDALAPLLDPIAPQAACPEETTSRAGA